MCHQTPLSGIKIVLSDDQPAGPCFHQERDPKRKIAWRQALVSNDGRMTMLLNGLETLLEQNWATEMMPFVAGKSLTVADLAIWRAVGWLSSGVIDGIPSTYVQQFPKLWALHCAVDRLPRLAEWKAKNPQHYARKR